jgi:hypothetical protein
MSQIGLKVKECVDAELQEIGSKKRYAEGQIASEHLAEAAELKDESGRSVYCHDRSVTPEERGAVKRGFHKCYAPQPEQEPAIA